MNWDLVTKRIPATIVYEDCAWPGVKRIAGVLADDICAVSGVRPDCGTRCENADKRLIAVMTAGRSEWAEQFPETAEIAGKREVYVIFQKKDWPSEGDDTLVICGSDKRGTIYGMLRLSRAIGVSPWIYWADVKPVHRERISLDESVLGCSKEPSVRYRGFFINDEWPSFGSWTCGHFNGFTKEMYEQVFLLLLRMNGNYLWPAMWSSSFPLDGPGLGNAELADELGVVMGTSHHEPCLRASEEWDIYKGDDTPYGKEWNYYTNREGLLRYWEDGLRRSGRFESVITIGMRGERDSSMLGPNSTLTENINLLKDIITEQRKRIRELVKRDGEVPQMLALYKEVEAYYYGSETEPGMLGWEEIEDVILLLCEDNYGNMRTLPTEAMKSHRGGFGMYYHFDYHGGPISYEWVNSTPLPKIWEQMTQAYESGVRDLWIVNVGDLKPQELPLSYFMDLAYDYDRYGITHPNETDDYLMNFVREQFGGAFDGNDREELLGSVKIVLHAYTGMNGARRPEALNAGIYRLKEEKEAGRMLYTADHIRNLADMLLERVRPEYWDSLYELMYFPAVASMNLIQMQIGAAANEAYLLQHDSRADDWEEYVAERIEDDESLKNTYHSVADGKWSGMMSSKHIGFRNWNDEGSEPPAVHTLADVTEGRYVPNPAFACNPPLCEEDFDITDLIMDDSGAPDWFRKRKVTVPEKTYIEGEKGICIEAENWATMKPAGDAKYVVLDDAGRAGNAVKCLPSVKSFDVLGDAPTLTYRVYVREESDYTLTMLLSPGNPYTIGENVRCGLSVNDAPFMVCNTIPDGYVGGNCFNRAWCEDVLNNIRTYRCEIRLKAGLNTITVKAIDPWMVLQKLIVRRQDKTVTDPYLGPMETYYTNGRS